MNLPGQGIQLYGRLNWRNLRDSSNDVKIMDNSDSLWVRRDFSVIARYRAPSPCQWPIWANECSTVVRLLKSRRPEAVDWRDRNSCIKASSGWMDTVRLFYCLCSRLLKDKLYIHSEENAQFFPVQMGQLIKWVSPSRKKEFLSNRPEFMTGLALQNIFNVSSRCVTQWLERRFSRPLAKVRSF